MRSGEDKADELQQRAEVSAPEKPLSFEPASVLRALGEATPDLVYVLSRDGQYLFVNGPAAQVLGLEVDQIVGRRWEEIGLDPAREREFVEERLRVMDSGVPAKRQVTFPTPTGERTFEYVVSPLLDHGGPPRGVIVVSRDITERASAERELRAQAARQGEQNAMLRTLLDVSEVLSAEKELEKLLQAVTDAATTLAGAEFGAFFYNVVNQAGESYMLWTISGVPRAAFSKFPMPRNTAIFAPTFSGEGIVRSDDIRADPRYGHSAPYHGMPAGHLPVVSYLAVPVISRSGEVIGGLFFGHSQRARFQEDVERLVAGVAAQAAIAIDNVRLLDQTRHGAAKLRAEEERYRTLVTATSQMVWTADEKGATFGANERWAKLTGNPPEDYRPDGWIDALYPPDKERVSTAWTMALAQGHEYQDEYRLRVQDGSYRWLAVRGVPVRNEDGSVREWIGTATDIDERKRVDESATFLADASALLTASLDPDTILSRLADLAVPRLADWCAIDVAQEHGPHRRLIIAHPDKAKAAMITEVDRDYRLPMEIDPVAQVMTTGKTQLVKHLDPGFAESYAQDERHREIIKTLGLTSWIIAPIVAGGRVYGTLSLVHAESGRRFTERDVTFVEDLTVRVGVAVHNAMLYVEAQAANRAKDEFLATLSHELRTPMTAIVGWARMLEMSDLDPALVQEAIHAITRGAKAQAQLIDDLLDVSRITLGKLHLNLDDVDIDDIVSAAVEAVQATASVKGIAVDVRLDPRRPHVAADASRLQQVIWNLVNNAVKFTPAGGRVDVSVQRVDASVLIRVADSGEGISTDFLPIMFDRFRQADSTTTRRFGGLGLGLSIVRQITELHGGTVEAASPGRGQGATFTVTLPLSRTPAVPEGERAAEQLDLPQLRGVDVLVVDDDAQARRFLIAALSRAGAAVRESDSVDAAMAALRARLPHVLVTDIAMPGRDGFALLEDIRHVLNIDEARLPAIAITAFGGTEDRVRILGAGFQRYVLKPVDPIELASIVAGVLAQR
jgi:PAS domain S-box-containing protein